MKYKQTRESQNEELFRWKEFNKINKPLAIKTKSQKGSIISCHQMKFPAQELCYIKLVLCQMGPMGVPKQPNILPILEVSSHKLRVRPYYRRQHLHNSMSMNKLSLTLYAPLVQKSTLHTTKEKR